jgi:hypothetical protein
MKDIDLQVNGANAYEINPGDEGAIKVTVINTGNEVSATKVQLFVGATDLGISEEKMIPVSGSVTYVFPYTAPLTRGIQNMFVKLISTQDSNALNNTAQKIFFIGNFPVPIITLPDVSNVM